MELVEHSVTAILIPMFWYCVGSLIDRRWVPKLHSSVALKGIAFLTLGVASVVCYLLVASLFHESGWRIFGLLGIAWSVVVIVFPLQTMRLSFGSGIQRSEAG